MSVKDFISDRLGRLRGALSRRRKKRGIRRVSVPEEDRRPLNIETSGALRSFGGPGKKKPRVSFDAAYFFRAMTQVFAAVFAVCAAVYFGYHLVRTFSSSVTVSTVYSITETDYRKGTAYIIRDETPVYAGIYGVADYSVDEGRRVAKGETFCSIYLDSTGTARAEIASLDEEIAGLRESLGAGTVVRGVLEVAGDVDSDYASVMAAIASGDFSGAADMASVFCTDLGRLTYLSGKGDGMLPRLQSLRSRRASVVAALGTPAGTVKAPSAGYLYYSCDGYEKIFGTKLVSGFTESALREAISSAPASTAGTVGKLVADPTWYAAVVTDGFDMDFAEPGEELKVSFTDNGGTAVSMEVVRKLRTADGVILLLTSSEMPEGFDYMREQNVRIQYNEVTGYRIPVSAVHRWEDMTGVYTLHGGYVYFRKINVLLEGEGYYIVSPYSEIEPGAPLTYRVIAYGDRGAIDDYAAMHEKAEELGLARSVRNNGGIPVKYGESYLYYYYLSDLEEIILKGSDLYHGKVLN